MLVSVNKTDLRCASTYLGMRSTNVAVLAPPAWPGSLVVRHQSKNAKKCPQKFSRLYFEVWEFFREILS